MLPASTALQSELTEGAATTRAVYHQTPTLSMTHPDTLGHMQPFTI